MISKIQVQKQVSADALSVNFPKLILGYRQLTIGNGSVVLFANIIYLHGWSCIRKLSIYQNQSTLYIAPSTSAISLYICILYIFASSIYLHPLYIYTLYIFAFAVYLHSLIFEDFIRRQLETYI
ncbi:hypothetical protein BJV82DRAFT_608147 [Fennellomyces sp. T-0311]|nr:hypothetical protein BJV82DRAFT_608147 [Fennellomyces sp. T-0311]